MKIIKKCGKLLFKWGANIISRVGFCTGVLGIYNIHDEFRTHFTKKEKIYQKLALKGEIVNQVTKKFKVFYQELQIYF